MNKLKSKFIESESSFLFEKENILVLWFVFSNTNKFIRHSHSYYCSAVMLSLYYEPFKKISEPIYFPRSIFLVCQDKKHFKSEQIHSFHSGVKPSWQGAHLANLLLSLFLNLHQQSLFLVNPSQS